MKWQGLCFRRVLDRIVSNIKDYAASHGVSYEAVRRQIARYSGREIDGFRISDHIIKVNRTQYLDNEATAFLDARRAQNPVVVQQEQRDETIERLRAEASEQKKRARDAENAAQEAAERADRAEQAAQEAEAKAERMSKAGLFARIFGTW